MTAKLAKKLGLNATAAEIAEARASYQADDARIQAAYAQQETSRCDEWCAKTGGTRDEYVALENFSEVWRDKLDGV